MSLFEHIGEDDSPGYSNEPVASPKMTQLTSKGQANASVPIFALDRVQFSFPGTLMALEVANNWLTMALETSTVTKDGSLLQRILWIDLGQTHQIEEIDFVPRVKQDRIRKIFLDPSAKHLILSTQSGDNFYLFKKWKKPKYLAKFRGIVVESIAWARARASEHSTGIILIGSRQGHIYEAELQPTDDFFKKEEKYFKQIYTIADVAMPITGLKFEKHPSSSNRYTVFMATPERLYQVSGMASDVAGVGYSFEDIFRHLDSTQNYQEIPGGGTGLGVLHFWKIPSENENNVSQKYAWLTASGIYHSALSLDTRRQNEAKMLPYPSQGNSSEEELPISFAVTPFHFVFLYKNGVKAVCELNGEVAYEENIPLERNEYIVGITADEVKGTYWVFTNSVLYELLVTDEDRDVWRLYLKSSKFESALNYVKTDNQRDLVLSSQAEYLYNQKNYMQAAEIYAQVRMKSFEEIALKFVGLSDIAPLKTFLSKKLEKAKRQDVTQTVILSSWLVEVFVQQLNNLKNSKPAVPPKDDESSENSLRTTEQALSEEFRSFLKSYKDRFDVKTIYLMLESHGRINDLLFFAETIGDFDRVVSHWISEKRWDRAIEYLGRQSNLELYYKYASVLFENAAPEAVNSWMKQPALNSRRLLPALLEAETGKKQCAVPLNVTDAAVHNYLLSLYVAQAKTEGEGKLIAFIQAQYALRLCSRERLTESCILIYSLMGLYEQAVSLALRHRDLELARINADKPTDDDALRKKLWLLIAQYVIEDMRDIKQALNYLKHCELLKIEDILPCFPDFVLIDEFKDDLCVALEDYNKHIQKLKLEMDEATTSAENIRQDIKDLKSRYAVLSVGEECAICNKPLFTRQFYVIKNVSASRGRRILDLNEKIQGLLTSEKTAIDSKKAQSKALYDQLKDANLALALDGPNGVKARAIEVTGELGVLYEGAFLNKIEKLISLQIGQLIVIRAQGLPTPDGPEITRAGFDDILLKNLANKPQVAAPEQAKTSRTLDQFPLLTEEEVTEKLRKNEKRIDVRTNVQSPSSGWLWSSSVNPPPTQVPPVSHTDTNSVNSNEPCEDQITQHGFQGRLIFSVFDGHGGPECGRVVAKYLPSYIETAISKLPQNVEGSSTQRKTLVEGALKDAFKQLDRDIINGGIEVASKSLAKADQARENFRTAISGACALVAYFEGNDLYVCCTGDSRAVLGTLTPNGQYIAKELSADQTVKNPQEYSRMIDEHPGELDTLFIKGRVLGGLMPTRAFADLQSQILAKISRRTVPRHFKTPPYVTAEPEVTHYTLNPERDKFLIMATDGLYDVLESEEAVQIVGEYIKQASGKEHVDSRRWLHIDQNAATDLIRNALGGKDTKRTQQLLGIPPPVSRRYRDDITAHVIFLREAKTGDNSIQYSPDLAKVDSTLSRPKRYMLPEWLKSI
ncbi:hypothetical protein HDU96_003999 [Phlyctochytrium bullatum]|nr:hypothetical protein HDU96_003999 [Phlyctochytrium bullatum]